MPGRDQTGPMGMGSVTDRGAGMCARVGMSGYENAVPGRGFGMGYGRGRRHRFYATGQPGWMRIGCLDGFMYLHFIYASFFPAPGPGAIA